MESLFLFTLDLLKVLIRKLEIIAQFKIQRDLVDICLNFGESKYTFDKLKEKKKKRKNTFRLFCIGAFQDSYIFPLT